MPDMGIRTTIAIENWLNRGTFREIADVMVDTGSEYTWVPRADLEAYRHHINAKVEAFECAGAE